MTTFIMLVGLPASGKSTYCDVFENFGYNIHSSDSIRQELTGNRADQSQNEKVFKVLHERIKNDLKNGVSTVYDATNISQKRRIAFLREIERFSAEKICFFIATPYPECLERDAVRDNPVGEAVIKRMYKSFWIPQKHEGWDNISILWSSPIRDNDINDVLKSLANYDQRTPFHKLLLGDHMKESYNYAFNSIVTAGVSPRDYENILLAIRIHDIGKPFTAQFDAEKDRVTYYQHELVGAYDALFYLRDLHLFNPIINDYSEEKKNDAEILDIVGYIQWHMYPYDIKQESTREKFIKLVGQDFHDALMFFHEADQAGH